MSRGRRGNCYVSAEALWYLLGPIWQPQYVKHEGDTHWFLVHRITGVVVDPTVQQFKTRPPYAEGRACGFLTKKPSKRAAELMDKLLWQEPKTRSHKPVKPPWHPRRKGSGAKRAAGKTKRTTSRTGRKTKRRSSLRTGTRVLGPFKRGFVMG